MEETPLVRLPCMCHQHNKALINSLHVGIAALVPSRRHGSPWVPRAIRGHTPQSSVDTTVTQFSRCLDAGPQALTSLYRCACITYRTAHTRPPVAMEIAHLSAIARDGFSTSHLQKKRLKSWQVRCENYQGAPGMFACTSFRVLLIISS
jgi:hypothetical protein